MTRLLIYANITEISPEQEKALLEYVRGGGGFVPLHCASYCFLNSPKYIALVGAQFQRHGTGEFDTKIVDPSHPIMKGFTPFTPGMKLTCTQHNERDRHPAADPREGGTAKSRGPGSEPTAKVAFFYTAYGHDERTW